MVKARGTITLARVDDGKDAAIQSDTAPSDKTKLWYDTVNNVFKSWDGSTWKVVNEVQVGGRNLLLYSSNPYANRSSGYYLSIGYVIDTQDTYNGCHVYKTYKAWDSVRFNFKKHLIDRNVVNVGDIITYSVMAKTDNVAPISAALFIRYTGQSNAEGLKYSIPLTNEWTKISVTFTVTEKMLAEATMATFVGFEQISNCEDGKYVYYACQKLEKGNKATDWTPAPEDVDSSINDAKDSANNAQESANTAISSVNDIRTSFGEYKDEVRAEFSSTVEYVDGKTEVVDNWIRQGTDGVNPYLELGGTGNSLKARLTNSRLGFYEGDKGLAYFGNNKAYMPDADIDRANIERIQIGSYALINNSDGHLTLVYVG